MISAIGFTAPWLLLTLIALPILWIILRAVPPAPIRRIFPGVSLLLGLNDENQVSDRTPWWLLLLRTLAVAALIVGLAGPVLNPRSEEIGRGPLLIAMDASWASAADWNARIEVLDRVLEDALRADRTVGLLNLSDPAPVVLQSATDVRAILPGIQPSAWRPTASLETLDAFLPEGDFDTVWFSDEVARETRAPLYALLSDRGAVRIMADQTARLALAPLRYESGATIVEARRTSGASLRDITVELHGRDPAGVPRVLATANVQFGAGETTAITELSLPAELRARLTHARIAGIRSAGAVTLSDDSLSRREVALFAGREDREGLELLSPLHYLRQALAPNADLLEGTFEDVLPAAPDVVVLADVDRLAPAEELDLEDWVRGGGMLVRFAGPRLAASDISRGEEHPLMPVRLRAGGRTVGGAMSWGTPKALAPFFEDSPFFGLPIPEDVVISSQVTSPDAADLAGSTWQPVQVLDGFGRISDAGTLPGVDGEVLLTDALGPALRPGLYEGEARRIARNVISTDSQLEPASWPAGTDIKPLAVLPETPLGGLLLSLALALLLIDIVASLALSGRLRQAAAVLALGLMPLAGGAEAQTEGASEMVLAHVITRDARLDDTALAGLRGLSETLFFRTSVEPADPVSVDLERPAAGLPGPPHVARCLGRSGPARRGASRWYALPEP